MSRMQTPGIDYTNKDYEAFRSMMIDALGITMPEYTDKSQTDAGIVILELMAKVLDILSFYQDAIANEVLLPTAEQRDSVLKWCNILGYYPRQATPSRIKQVFVLSSAQKSNYKIPAGTLIRTKDEINGSFVYFETAEDLIIPAGKLGNEQDENMDYIYSVDAIQGISIYSERVGSSSGLPDQSFTLKYTPVLADYVKVYVNEGSGFEPWTQVQNFIDSSPTSKHYVVSVNDRDEATITFGNGNFGKIPSKFDNGIYADYRTGGGTVGNVGANKVTVIDSPIALVSSTFNPYLPFENGSDKESIESIKVNAPNAHRTLWGALTIEDFSDLVKLEIPEVKYAVSKEEGGINVLLYVLLQNGELLDESVKAKILDLFDEDKGGRKLVGVGTITVEGPTFVELDFEANLVVYDGYSRSKVEDQIKQYLEYYFQVGNYDFNTELSITGLSSDILIKSGIEGIKSFKFTSPSQDVMQPEINEIYKMRGISFSSSGGVE